RRRRSAPGVEGERPRADGRRRRDGAGGRARRRAGAGERAAILRLGRVAGGKQGAPRALPARNDPARRPPPRVPGGRRGGRRGAGEGSAQAWVVTALAHAPAFVDLLGTEPTRAGAFITGRSIKGARYRVFWPCRDGYVNFIFYGGAAGRRTNEQLVAWMRERDAELGALAGIDWTSWDPTKADQAEVDAIEAPVMKFFAGLSKREFLIEGPRREMLGYPVSTVADIASDPQLAARGFFQAVGGSGERFCGSFALIDGERPPL